MHTLIIKLHTISITNAYTFTNTLYVLEGLLHTTKSSFVVQGTTMQHAIATFVAVKDTYILKKPCQ